MILNSNKLVVSVITKPAPQLSPLCPPRNLFIKCGINIEVVNPEAMQYINNKVLGKFKLVEEKKNIMPIQIIINEGLISFEMPLQYF